jgi:pimeloyl-ACP methyl ester carboxylesterase
MLYLKPLFGVGCVLVFCTLIFPSSALAAEPDPGLSAMAKTVVDQLVGGQFEALTTRFDSTMKAALPVSKLRETWAQVLAQAGAFQRQTSTRQEKAQNYDLIFVTCAFAKTPLDVKVVFNSSKEIAGLFITPVQQPPATMKASPAAAGIVGSWQGTLQAGPQQLRLVLKVSQNAEGMLSAKMDSVDQGAMDLPVSKISLTGNSVTFEISMVGGSYEGTWDKQKQEISGQWSQGGMSLPLTFKKVDKPVARVRPQEPQKPYPYLEEEVAFKNTPAQIGLAGTLTYPQNGGPFPAVLLISGSGPQDRNETVFGHRPFLVLADYLTKHGIAVLRWDDRGVGGSSGNTMNSTSQDFAQDVLAAVEFLKTRREINPRQIGLLGHSEGGMVAPLAAANSKDISFIVLMAGPGITSEELLYKQGELILRSMGNSEDTIALNQRLQRQLFAVLKLEPDNDLAEKKIRESTSQILAALPESQKALGANLGKTIEGQMKGVLTPWFRFFISYDPKPALTKLSCPVLALNGEKDLQVPPREDLEGIEAALKSSGRTDYKTVLLPGLNHLFQTCQTGSLAEYSQIEETIAPIVLETIATWIQQTGLKTAQ